MPLPPLPGMSSSSSIRGAGDICKLPLYSLITDSNSSLDESSSSTLSPTRHINLHPSRNQDMRPHATTSPTTPCFNALPKPLSPSWLRMPTKARFLADFTLGFADGLTVPFALTAGLSSLGRTDTVVYAGVAEICAGSISMGIGGYLSARGDGAVTERRDRGACSGEEEGMERAPLGLGDGEKSGRMDEVVEYLRPLELPPWLFEMVLEHVRVTPHVSETLTARGEWETERESKSCSPVLVGLSVSSGYLLGGILPLFPYFFVERVGDGLFWSFGVCLMALFAFGFTKDFVLNRQCREESENQLRMERRRGFRWKVVRHSAWEGLQMVLLGGVAALAAVLCVRAFEGLRDVPGDAAL